MARKYRIKDISAYMLEQYGLDWDECQIKARGRIRRVRFEDYQKDKLSVKAIVKHDGTTETISLNVDNKSFEIIGRKQPAVSWGDYLESIKQTTMIK